MAELEGYEDVVRSMRALPEKLQRKVLRKGLRAGAAVLRADARANAPKDTGALKRNIIVENTSPKGSLVKLISSFAVGVESGKVGAITGGKIKGKGGKTRNATRREKAGEDPYYWIWQEKGFRAVGRAEGKGRIGRERVRSGGTPVPGKHFIENALKHNQTRILLAIRNKLKTEIEKENGRRG